MDLSLIEYSDCRTKHLQVIWCRQFHRLSHILWTNFFDPGKVMILDVQGYAAEDQASASQPQDTQSSDDPSPDGQRAQRPTDGGKGQFEADVWKPGG